MKLLNIDAAAQFLIQDYNGPRLPQDSVVKNVKPVVSKDKKEMIDSVVSTLGNLIKSEELLKMNIDTGMGFYIGWVYRSCFIKTNTIVREYFLQMPNAY